MEGVLEGVLDHDLDIGVCISLRVSSIQSEDGRLQVSRSALEGLEAQVQVADKGQNFLFSRQVVGRQ